MLSPQDITGLYAIIPTPAKPDAARIGATDTVDLVETERLVQALIRDGASGLIALGTTGECATLSQTDYRKFVGALLEIVDRRIPAFVGSSALGGHDVADRLRFIKERKADGTLLGLPMWQPVSTDMAVDFYSQISEAFPEIAVMVYANARAFRYSFPVEFWEAISVKAPTVISAKFSRPKNLLELIEKSKGRVHFVPNEMTVANFFETSPGTTTACWATAAGMGPGPVLALMNALRAKDKASIDQISKELLWANEPLKSIFAAPEIFASYNIQIEKARINAAGYSKCGPCRPPYDHLPEEYAAAARDCGTRWATLQTKYAAEELKRAG